MGQRVVESATLWRALLVVDDNLDMVDVIPGAAFLAWFWAVVEGEQKKGNKVATVNRYLALIRCLLRMARDEWQWIAAFPKIRLLAGEVERDRWLTRKEARRLVAACPPHLAAMVRFALATGCRAREISGLDGTPRGVPLNDGAVAVLDDQRGKHPQYCFTYRGEPIRWELTNSAWHTALRKAGIEDFGFTTSGIPGRRGIGRRERLPTN